MSSILIIDDEPALCAVLRDHLVMEGYDVRTRGDGESGLEHMLADPPDLVLLDVMLPGMDGYEVCSQMQADPALARVPVIMLTALATTSDVASAYETGVDDFVAKPFEIDELLARIRAQIRHRSRTPVSDLTGLPGGEVVEERLAAWNAGRDARSVLRVEINGFRAYNEAYTFSEGDNLIRLAAETLRHAIEECGEAEAFLGHSGGPNFVAIVGDATVACLLDRTRSYFDKRVQQFYSRTDRNRGYLVALDREGRARRWPLATLRVDVVRRTGHTVRV